MENNGPDYKRIYTDIILMKNLPNPENFDFFLKKEVLTSSDVIKLNHMIFKSQFSNTNQLNQKHKSYDLQTIMEILEFQKKSGYNNSQMAVKFNMSRNSLAKWKNIYK